MRSLLRHTMPVAVLALGLAVMLPADSSADHSWGNYHWAREANPITLEVGDNVSSTWDAYLSEASDDWNVSSVVNTTVVAGGTSPRRCKATAGRIEACNDRYGFNGWLGIAQIWANGDHIVQGVVKLNDSYHDSPPYNDPAWRRLVMCQEIAHTFGLDHQDEEFNNANLGSCMDYTSDPDGPPSNEHPNAHDFDQLETIYAHLDGGGGGGGGGGNCPPRNPNCQGNNLPPAMTDIDFAGPGQWGQLVARSHDGGQEVYVLDFGQGRRVITFVTWTLERANPEH